jgi:hypothetical protein
MERSKRGWARRGGATGGTRPWWRRKRVLIPAGLFAFVILVGALGAPPKRDGAVASAGTSSRERTSIHAASAQAAVQSTPTATADPLERARSRAARLARRGEFATAATVYAAVGLDRDAARVRRAGAHTLLRSARAALAGGRYGCARRLAIHARRLHATAATGSVLEAANAGIAQAAAAARLARDRRTCSSAEKATVRAGGGVPAGCAAYAASQTRKAQAQQAQATACDPNYKGACLKPDSPDYDCAGGSGNGPDYTGPVEVVGDDHYGLDADGDGYACEG